MNRTGFAAIVAGLLLASFLPAQADSPAVEVCWGYGCAESQTVQLSPADWDAIQAIFSPPAGTPAAERNRIARAIARFERGVGALTGTSANLGGNLAGSGQSGQMDCLDETHNTTAYLELLANAELLQWHQPGEPERRAPRLFDQHWTATVVDQRTGATWTVDSWFHDNGSRPFIVPIEEWRRGARP